MFRQVVKSCEGGQSLCGKWFLTPLAITLFLGLLIWEPAGGGLAFAQAAGPPVWRFFGMEPLLDFIKVFGFGFLIFFIWYGDYRKIGKLTKMVERYEALAKSHEALTQQCHDTMLLTMQVNTRLVERLDYILSHKEHPAL